MKGKHSHSMPPRGEGVEGRVLLRCHGVAQVAVAVAVAAVSAMHRPFAARQPGLSPRRLCSSCPSAAARPTSELFAAPCPRPPSLLLLLLLLTDNVAAGCSTTLSHKSSGPYCFLPLVQLAGVHPGVTRSPMLITLFDRNCSFLLFSGPRYYCTYLAFRPFDITHTPRSQRHGERPMVSVQPGKVSSVRRTTCVSSPNHALLSFALYDLSCQLRLPLLGGQPAWPPRLVLTKPPPRQRDSRCRHVSESACLVT